MNASKLIFVAAFLFLAAQISLAQVNKPSAQTIKSSPAYAEVLLQKTELTAELENLLVDYTDEYPRVKGLRFQIGLLQKDLEKMLATPDVSRLTQPLGKLLVRRAELATDLWNLQSQYSDDKPDVKRAKRKVEIYEQAIREILP
jgi:uncharacterized protein involved in exopolysaccharide biosynthesis